jgi:O-antigen ligase
MERYILLRKLTEAPGAVDYQQLAERPKVVILKEGVGTNDVLWIIRYAYYAFIVSLPFETANIGVENGLFSLSKLVGYAFMMAALLRPRLSLKCPPRAFWLFTLYLCVVALLGMLQEPQFHSLIVTQLFTQTQLLILFCISYNLMRYERIRQGTVLALAVSCVVLGILMASDITAGGTHGRATAFGANPNAIAGVLSLGLLALVGFAYGREHVGLKVRLLTWLSFGILASALIRTGSRGATLGVVAGFMAFLLKGKSLETKIKIGLIVVLGIGSLVWASMHIEAVRVRWESTLFQGDVAGRERIFQTAWELFQEKPLFGWGPVHHYFELGARLGLPTRDPHNLYLWILIETGLLGAMPFFAGLWFCWQAAWKARHSTQGVLPMAMILCLLIITAKGTWLTGKLFWIVLSYALASNSSVSSLWRWRVRSAHTWPTHGPAPATSSSSGYVTPFPTP